VWWVRRGTLQPRVNPAGQGEVHHETLDFDENGVGYRKAITRQTPAALAPHLPPTPPPRPASPAFRAAMGGGRGTKGGGGWSAKFWKALRYVLIV